MANKKEQKSLRFSFAIFIRILKELRHIILYGRWARGYRGRVSWETNRTNQNKSNSSANIQDGKRKEELRKVLTIFIFFCVNVDSDLMGKGSIEESKLQGEMQI